MGLFSRTQTFQNWNGTSKCYPSRVEYPTIQEEIRAIVRKARQKGKRIRVVGGGVHTWGNISMCDKGDYIVCLKKYNRVLQLDKKALTVTAQAGIALEDLIPKLERERVALQNMGEATEQSLGGVTATGTHGSGGGLSSPKLADSFSDQVLSYKICDLTDQANIRTIRKGDPDFEVFMVHLGVLAIVLEVTLQLRTWYHLEWQVKDLGDVSNLTLDMMKQRYTQVFNVTYTIFPETDQVVEIVRDYTDNTTESGIASDVKDDFVATLRQGTTRFLGCCPCFVEPYANVQKRALLSLSGNSDQWRKVLSQGDLWGGVNFTWNHDQEYACPIEKALEAVNIIQNILKARQTRKIPTAVGIRFIRGSPALLACHYSELGPNDVFAYIEVQFSAKKVDPNISIQMQEELSKIGCRAHWGKQNATTADLIVKNTLWPARNMNKFALVKQQYDPDNILGSDYTDRILKQSKPTSPPTNISTVPAVVH